MMLRKMPASSLLLVRLIFTIIIVLERVLVFAEEVLQLPDLPVEHYRPYLYSFPFMAETCIRSNPKCHFILTENRTLSSSKDATLTTCWGFERGCKWSMRYHVPSCSLERSRSDKRIHSANKESLLEMFHTQADFGYVKQQINELLLLCEPTSIMDSSLECSRYLRFCRGRRLRLDLRGLAQRREHIRYHTDVLKSGQISGFCKLNSSLLEEQLDHMGALQSWSPELRNFQESSEPFYQNSKECDVIITTPTFLMKIDATYNMYHHFCDFFNLYATLFVNQTHHTVFDTNTQIIIWETYPYDSPFAATFKAFTHNPIWTLASLRGRRVCFQNVVLPLLPRMLFGLYYNTPIIQGCQGSGIFKAFAEFILYRLRITMRPPSKKRIRITFLSRLTKYRRVLNEQELLQEILGREDYDVKKVTFDREFDFERQLEITRNTDILVSMHGAGLTHLLFLPNWATVFELYNCEDANCYKDLARLRGVNYITWEKRHLVYPQDQGHHPEGGAHAKFTNYSFDAKEFARLIAVAANQVRNHLEYQQMTDLTNTTVKTRQQNIRQEL